MRVLLRKVALGLSLALILQPVQGFAGSAEGKVLTVSEFAPGLWKVVVQEASGEQAYMVSTKTVLGREVPVERLKTGDRLVAKAPKKGVKGFKAPFENMAASAKKALGLPNIPSVPEVPKIPPIPSKQERQGSPLAPKGKPDQGAAPGGMPGKEPPKEAPPVKTQDEMLQETGFQNEKLLFPPQEGQAAPGVEVTQVTKTDLGYEITVVSETGKPEKQKYAPGNKVLTVLSLKEIKKNDVVALQFNEKDKSVTQLKVQG